MYFFISQPFCFLVFAVNRAGISRPSNVITVHFSPKEERPLFEAMAASKVESFISPNKGGSNFPEETAISGEVKAIISASGTLFSRSVAVSYNDTFHTIFWELEMTKEENFSFDVSIEDEVMAVNDDFDAKDATLSATSNTLQKYLISIVFCLSATFACKVLL